MSNTTTAESEKAISAVAKTEVDEDKGSKSPAVAAAAATSEDPSSSTISKKESGSQKPVANDDDADAENKETRKTPRTNDEADADTKEPASKKSRGEESAASAEASEPAETMDLAIQLGLKDGDRLQVEWELETEDENGQEEMSTRWWGCTLLPHDGRTEDSVAIRTLDYDPYPQGGFPERSQEDVIFLSHEILINPENHAEFRYRPEDMVQFSNEEETREAINEILMETMRKHAGTWGALTPAQQASIADGIAQKKEQLVEAIMSHSQDKSAIIGPDEMREILAGLMR